MKFKRQKKNTLPKGYLLTHYRIEKPIGGGGFSFACLPIADIKG